MDQTGAGNLAARRGTFDNQAGATYDISGTGGIVTGTARFRRRHPQDDRQRHSDAFAPLRLERRHHRRAERHISIQSTNCNWTGGNLEAASGATLQLAPAAGGNGITLTGTYTGSGAGQSSSPAALWSLAPRRRPSTSPRACSSGQAAASHRTRWERSPTPAFSR